MTVLKYLSALISSKNVGYQLPVTENTTMKNFLTVTCYKEYKIEKLPDKQ